MDFSELILVALLLSDVALCATGRLKVLVRIAAFQGALLGLLALVRPPFELETALLAAATILIKTVVFPYVLARAIERSGAESEPKPYVGYNLSILIAAALFGASTAAAGRLPAGQPALFTAAAFFTLLTGLFIIVSRKTAFSQVIGYLSLEGGICAFGLALPHGSPVEVELGLLLDIFVAVFIMGIVVYHISREFEHADMAEIAFLNDSEDYD